MKTKQKVVELPSPPKKWEDLTLEQWKVYHKLTGKYASDTAFLAKAFLLLCGLKPLLYAERWRMLLSRIPFIGRYVRMTGRQVISADEDHIRWKQFYRLKKTGQRFWMEDEEVLSFQKSIEFMTTEPVITHNPVEHLRILWRKFPTHKRRLSDMNWATYNTCNAYVSSYFQTKDKSFLYQFIRVLYRIPVKFIPYISKSVNTWQLQLILLFWNGCQKDFAKQFRRLFKEGKKNNQSKKKDYLVQESEISVFIGKESHLPPEGVRNMLVWDALTYLDQNARKLETEEKQLAKLKSNKRF